MFYRMKTVTVCARIPEELKRELVRYGVKVSDVVRRALAEEVERRREAERREAARVLGEALSKLSDEEIVASIREFRRAR